MPIETTFGLVTQDGYAAARMSSRDRDPSYDQNHVVTGRRQPTMEEVLARQQEEQLTFGRQGLFIGRASHRIASMEGNQADPTELDAALAAFYASGRKGMVVGRNLMRRGEDGGLVTGRSVGYLSEEQCQLLREQVPKQRPMVGINVDFSRLELFYGVPPRLRSPFSNHLKRGLGFELQLRYLIAARLTEGRIVR